MSDLSLLFVFPFIAAFFTLFLPLKPSPLKRFAVTLSFIPLLFLLYRYDHWIGSNINYNWLPPLDIHFHLSVDALSLFFLFLTSIIIPIAIAATSSNRLTYPHAFYSLVFFLQALLFGFFTAQDLALFTIFWEGMLIPMFFIINVWGGTHRRDAAVKFLIYMIAGSALMVAAVLALYITSASQGTATFNISELATIAQHAPHIAIIAAIFLLAFAVKTPLFPFHAWLPNAYYEASTSGTILLSAILSKAGIYGILRIGIELFPQQLQAWSPLLIVLAILGVLYGSLAAWMQTDFKRLIAYSSFAHVNFILVGLFVWNETAHTGAVLQAFNHSITITALFLAVGWLTERLHTTSFGVANGLAKYLPQLCWLTFFFVLASVALPGTNNFIGEFLVFFGLFTQHHILTAILGLSVILSVVYMLHFMSRIYFNPPSPFQPQWVDIKSKEWCIAAPLIALILWVGIYPTPFLNLAQPAAEKNLLQSISTTETRISQ